MFIDIKIWIFKLCEIVYCVVDINGLCIEVCLSGVKVWWYWYCYVGKFSIIMMVEYFVMGLVEVCVE